ncbi:hypothetical protein KHA80_05725 [Anaerobacillus sp. HL2]|nr:hypothetical protein KHA80_05725 [Anaerobacillus sp. HL2]
MHDCYFEPELKKVTFPWDLGQRPEDIFEYFQTKAIEEGFNQDYIHAVYQELQSSKLNILSINIELWFSWSLPVFHVQVAICHLKEMIRKKISSHC